MKKETNKEKPTTYNNTEVQVTRKVDVTDDNTIRVGHIKI